MELHEFVRETLVQIIRGVAAAQDDEVILQNHAAVVAAGPGTLDDKNVNREVDFDIVVTTQSGSRTRGGVGVFVGPVGLGSEGRSEQSRDSVNRINFSVPICLPVQKRERSKKEDITHR